MRFRGASRDEVVVVWAASFADSQAESTSQGDEGRKRKNVLIVGQWDGTGWDGMG